MTKEKKEPSEKVWKAHIEGLTRTRTSKNILKKINAFRKKYKTIPR